MVEKMREKGRGFGQYDNLEVGGKDRDDERIRWMLLLGRGW